jgi:hypothetical protein
LYTPPVTSRKWIVLEVLIKQAQGVIHDWGEVVTR